MSADGIVYDAYTLDRWSDDKRSDEMLQQTPSAVGEPWNKVVSLGTNMKQLTDGPDGSPNAVFEGAENNSNMILLLTYITERVIQ